jgi:hypothetical protein
MTIVEVTNLPSEVIALEKTLLGYIITYGEETA